MKAFDEAGGRGKPRYGEVSVCWAENEREARETAFEIWPNAAMSGQLSQELALPAHFEQVVPMVTKEKVAEEITCGPDVKKHVDAIRKYVDAGYDHVCVHQIGPDQSGFMNFYQREVLPAFEPASVR